MLPQMPRSGLMVLAVLSFSAAAFAQPPAKWESRGPGGGGAMYSPSLSPHNVDELYVACDMSPEFHSADYGKTWETLDFRQFWCNQASAVRFTKDTMILWSLSYASPRGENIVRPLRSVDGGKSWQIVDGPSWPEGRRANAIEGDFANPDKAFVVAESRHLWVTLDGGKSWKSNFQSASGGLTLVGSFCDGETIYLGTSAGLLVSRDGGKSFAVSEVGGLGAGAGIVGLAGAKQYGKVRLFALVTSRPPELRAGRVGITRSVYVLDIGGEWVKKSEGLDSEASISFIACSVGEINVCYVGGGVRTPQSGMCVFKTANGGDKWENIFLIDGNKNIASGWAGDGGDFRWSYPEYVLGMGVSPIDPNRVVITDLGCVHATSDGGKSWRALYTTPSRPHESGKPTPRCDTYRGMGMEPTSAWCLCWMDRENIFAGFTDIRGVRSTDGGKTWGWTYTGHSLNSSYHVLKHPTRDLAFMSTSSVHDMYRSSYLADGTIDRGSGLLLYSADKGASWKCLHDFGHPVIWSAIDPRSPNRMMASVIHSREGGIWMTQDADKLGESTWTRLPQPPRTEGHPMNCHFLDDGSLLVSFSGRRAGNEFTASSGVFISCDSGKSWEDRSAPGLKFWVKELVIDPADKSQNTWYACTFDAWTASTGPEGKDSGLFRTTDRGKNWTQIADKRIAPSGILNANSCTVNPDKPDELYLTSEYDGLFYTDNARADKPTFTQVNSYPFRNPTGVFFNPLNKREVWATSFGNGMYVGEVQ